MGSPGVHPATHTPRWLWSVLRFPGLQSAYPEAGGLGFTVLTFRTLWSHPGQHSPGILWVCPNVQRRGMTGLSLYLPSPPWSLTSEEQGARIGLELWESIHEGGRVSGSVQSPRGAGVESIWAPGSEASGLRIWNMHAGSGGRDQLLLWASWAGGVTGHPHTHSCTSANDLVTYIPSVKWGL